MTVVSKNYKNNWQWPKDLKEPRPNKRKRPNSAHTNQTNGNTTKKARSDRSSGEKVNDDTDHLSVPSVLTPQRHRLLNAMSEPPLSANDFRKLRNGTSPIFWFIQKIDRLR